MDIGSLTGQIALEDQLTDKLTLGITSIKNFVTSFDGMVGTVAIGAGVIASAFAGAVVSIVALGQKGSTILGVEDAFNRLSIAAGSTGEAMIGALSQGVRGTVDSMELMQGTTRLLSSGLKLTDKDMLLLAQTAREMGKATGTNATEGINVLSGAMLTGNARMLRRYGIQLDLVGAEKQFRESLGGTTAALSAAGKLEVNRIAVLEGMRKKMEALGTSELTFKERIQQISVSIGDWTDSLAKAVASSPNVMRAFDAIGDALRRTFGGSSQALLDFIVRWVNRFADFVTRYGPPIIVALGRIRDGIVYIWDIVTKSWDRVPDWFKRVAVEAGTTAGAIYLTTRALGALGGSSSVLDTIASFATITSGLKDFGTTLASIGPRAITQIKGIYDHLKVYYLLGSFAGGGVVGGVAGVLTGIGDAFRVLAGSTVGLAALFVALGAAIWQVVRAIQAFEENWKRGGGTMWGFLTLKDDDNFIRRWFGLAQGIDTAATSLADLRKEMEKGSLGLGHQTGKSPDIGGGEPPALFIPEKTAYDAFVDSTNELNKVLQTASKHQMSLNDQVERYGDAASKAAQDAAAWGVKLKKSIRTVADAFDSKEFAIEARLIRADIAKVSDDIIRMGQAANREFDAAIEAIKQDIFGLDNAIVKVGDSLDEALDVEAVKNDIQGVADYIENIPEPDATKWDKMRGALSVVSTILDNISGTFAEIASMAARAGEAIIANLAEGDVFGAIVAGATAAVGIITKLIGATRDGRNAIKAFADSFDTAAAGTGFDELQAEIGRLGKGSAEMWIALTQGVPAGNETAAKAAIKRVQAALAALDEDIQKYALTWMDMADAQSGGTKTGDALVASFKRLTDAGFTAEATVKGMSEDLNAYIANSLKAGTQIPAAMRPIIEQLITMGGLTDANARAMLGLAADTMPSLADITAAADRYGISLDSLGPKVKQLQITELANQYVKDWDILTAATDDWSVIIDKMGPDVQKLITDAMKYGSELPASMKPMIQAFIDAGELVDENGVALTDLSQLTFAADLSEMFEGLMLKLDELIAKITDGVGGALSDIGNRTVHPKIAPVYSEDYGPSQPEEPSYMARGGKVLPWRPRGTDTVPAMLTPGETVIPAGREQYVAEVKVPLNIDDLKLGEAIVKVVRKVS